MEVEVCDDQMDGIRPTIIKVIGVGGGGSNAITRMLAENLDVEFIAVNTDIQALNAATVSNRLAIGKKITNGLGAGGKPDVGRAAAEESVDEIRSLVAGSGMVFLTAGMGGGTGTGAIPVIGRIAKEEGVLTVAVVTTPFAVEGKPKALLAEKGIAELRENVDTLIVVPNQSLLQVAGKNTTILEAFRMVDDVLAQGVQGISELILNVGIINIDFNDVQSVMRGRGDAIMGIGFGSGENAAIDAATGAINNPLLADASIEGASAMLVNITVGDGFSISAYDGILDLITANVDDDAQIISGLVMDSSMGERVKVSVVATGFKSAKRQNEEALILEEEGTSNMVTSHEYDLFASKAIANHEQSTVSSYSLADDLNVPPFLRKNGRVLTSDK